MILPDEKVVIVGAGCFGLSTAYHLLKRGFTDITVLDRSVTLPAPDAASNDFNRIVRSSYSDIFYARLAREAILSWKDTTTWSDTYHESGVVVLGPVADASSSYADESYYNDMALGAAVQPLSTSGAIRAVLPSGVRVGALGHRTGYLNRDGGWANAAQGVSLLLGRVASLGGKVIPGKSVRKLVRGGGATKGVECSDGTIYDAALVVLATGSWTASAFPEINLGQRFLATGQCIAMVQLTEAEANIYKKCPVVLDFASGFYVFPPNEAHVVKLAVHSPGYTHTVQEISTPRTVASNSQAGLAIPKVALQALRAHLRGVYPDLAGKPFSGTRLCWYNDSADGDWVIGLHPDDPSLVLATAGCGHAYKFLPVIGRLVADVIQGILEPSLVDKFAVDRVYTHIDQSRAGEVMELDLEQLCVPADLLPEDTIL